MIKTFIYDEFKEFSSNTYVIGKISSSCLIIDPGSSSPDVIEYVKSHHNKIEAILLTHGHFDHIRGISNILKNFDYEIPVYLSNNDKYLLTDPILNCASRHQEKVIININTIDVEDLKEIQTASFNIIPICTPFHTNGSTCYLIKEDNALFTGDTLFKESIGRDDLPTSNPSLKNKSLKKLKELSPNYVIYPGHGEISNLAYELQNNPFLK